MGKITKVRLYDFEGNKLQDFNSVTECAQKIGINASGISACITGVAVQQNNFQFKELTDRTPNLLPSLVGYNTGGLERKKIGKYWDNKLICVYNSINETSRKNPGIVVASICVSMIKNTKINGFKFKEII